MTMVVIMTSHDDDAIVGTACSGRRYTTYERDFHLSPWSKLKTSPFFLHVIVTFSGKIYRLEGFPFIFLSRNFYPSPRSPSKVEMVLHESAHARIITSHSLAITFASFSSFPYLWYKTTMTSATNTTTTSAQLDNATLRERILTSGAGNARGSLTKVASQYREFIHQLMHAKNNDNDGTEDNDNGKKSILAAAATTLKTELQLHDLEIRKSILSSQAYSGNSSTYSATLSQMQSSLSSIQNDIETLTSTLIEQRQIHSRRKEYNALAKIANEKHPPIHKTRAELQEVTEQIEVVEREVGEITEKLSVREKQLRVLMSCLGDLKASLNEEEIRKETSNNEDEEGVVEEIEEVVPPSKKRRRDE